MQIILADGSIVEANRSAHSDLFTTLKGGGNNFGIISRFRLATFKQTDVFNLVKSYEESQLERLYDAIIQFNIEAPTDPAASAQLSIAFVDYKRLIVIASMVHTKNKTDRPIFEMFQAVPSIRDEASNLRMSEMAEVMDTNNPSGYR